mmetsp:Transcript_13020/g.22501  ORF Transcript_13020/g.22501 Transcript_13020/m.22501 type:complete len:392 (+) Transcript_13020:114-1289(+)
MHGFKPFALISVLLICYQGIFCRSASSDVFRVLSEWGDSRRWDHLIEMELRLRQGKLFDGAAFVRDRPWLARQVPHERYSWLFWVLNDTDHLPVSFVDAEPPPSIPQFEVTEEGFLKPESSGVFICAVAKNEGPYLREWFSWHYALGVEGIFVYDHMSVDGNETRSICQSSAPFVTYTYWPEPFHLFRTHQTRAYADCLRRLSNPDGTFRAAFVAFIDVDEYIFLAHPQWRIRPFLDSLLALHPERDVAGVYLHWRQFDSAGKFERQSSSTICQYLSACRTQYRNHYLGKYVVRPQHISAIAVHNVVLTPKDAVMLSVDGRPMIEVTEPVHSPACLNHYWSRSLLEYIGKVVKREKKMGSISLENFFEEHLDCFPSAVQEDMLNICRMLEV